MPNPARSRNISLAILMIASGLWGYESTGAFSATPREEMLSFDMWCLEMRLYPPQRCDTRRTEDVKAYEQYRAEVENYDRTRTTREQRDQQLQQKLNPDSGSAKTATPAR